MRDAAVRTPGAGAPQDRRTGAPSGLVRAGLIVFLTLLAYMPALRAGFLWDDDRYVTRNAFVRSAEGLPHIWTSARTRDYYPVLYTSFWLEWRLWGEQAAGYHATNVVLHALNAILLWLLLARFRVPGAWLCGLLFAVHPINVESVAWISQRKNTLAMLFFLLCAITYPPPRAPGRFPRYHGALLLFVASLLTKPIAIMFPVFLLAWHVYSLNFGEGGLRPFALDIEAPRNARRTFFRALGEALPFFAVAAICGAMTIAFQQAHALKGVPVGAETLLGQVLTASRALLFYIGKTFAPVRLMAVYPQWDTDTVTPAAVLPFLLILATLGLCILKRKTWGAPALLAAAWFVLMLFPVLGFLDIGFMFYAMVADHWVYPALPALLAVVVGPLAARLSRTSPARQRAGHLVAGALVLLLASATFLQARLYRDMPTLAADTVRKNPRAWVAHVLLGNAAFSDRALDRAARHYRAALAEKPGYWEALNGLGIVYASQGRLAEAIPLFEAVLDAKPEHTHARRNLAIARRQQAAKENPERGTRNAE